MINDTFKHKGLRKQLVDGIKKKGINDENVLNAINKVPRHIFIDSSFTEIAYSDTPFPIGCGQTISQPYTVAFQTSLLEVKKGDKILEIGTGCGYQACILAEMGAKVFTIERIRELYIKTKNFLSEMKYSIRVFYGDGYKGLPTFAPFDKILVTAAAPVVPNELLKQLKINGRLVIPMDVEPGLQEMTTIDRINENDFDTKKHGYFRFVPMVKNKE